MISRDSNGQFIKGHSGWNKDQQLSQEHKDNLSRVRKGKHTSPKTEFKTGHSPSKESKRKMSESHIGMPSVNKGKKGLFHHSEEHKRELSKAWTGDKNPAKRQDVRAKISKARTGIKFSDETKERISKSHKGLQTGDKHPNWIGGISFEPYCQKFNEQLKEMVRERDDRTCQLCNVKENGVKLSVHHIHYDKPNCEPDLISLCRSCHAKTSFNRNYYEGLFIDNLKQRGYIK